MENCKVLTYTLSMNDIERGGAKKIEKDISMWIDKGYSVKGCTSHAMHIIVVLEKVVI